MSLNPQPIPPGDGRGHRRARHRGSRGRTKRQDSSIIIVGGTEAPLADVASAQSEAPVTAAVEVAEPPMEDVASAIAVEM
ncbi:MAG: hypothetical protein M3313_07770, partial [Actinomycetota bacterium]|nr:hypothetical protein [Actinomycetota bacterium]